MRFTYKPLLLVAGLAVAACTDASRFDNDPSLAGDSVALNNSGIIPGTANDPSSPAYFSQTIGDRVLFPVDQSSLTTDAQIVLDGQAQWLLLNADYLAVIEGHADEQGTREYNLALGARRASAVQQYLISQGIAASRLKTVTFGKERPLEICSEEACYAKNRRAVSVLNGGTS